MGVREIAHGVCGTVFKLGRESERELSGRGDVAEQDFGKGSATPGTVPPALDNGRRNGLQLSDEKFLSAPTRPAKGNNKLICNCLKFSYAA